MSNARVLKLTMGHAAPDRDGNVLFWMQEKPDGTPLPFPMVTGDDANDATVGETAIWEVKNTAHGDHNFHPHGFMFQPLEVEYWTCDETLTQSVFVRKETFDFAEEKDTIRVPGAPLPACYIEDGRMVCPVCQPGTAYTVLRAAVNFDATGREDDVEAYGKAPT